MTYTGAGFYQEMQTVRSGYAALGLRIIEEGTHVRPRGMDCIEVRGATIVVKNSSYDAMPHGIGRNLNLAIGAAEALQLVSGRSYPELMVRITKNFDRFRDGGILHGAYGPRVRAQLPTVVRRLEDDPDTRQAVMTIWDPAYDLYGDTPKDVPCTVQLQFMIRAGHLELHTYMRSNDFWWGFAYDVFQFSILQHAVANALDVKVGDYAHHVGSLHVYERDRRAVMHDLHPITDDVDVLRPSIGKPGEPITASMYTAQRILEGDISGLNLTPQERWFVDTLEPYVQRVVLR